MRKSAFTTILSGGIILFIGIAAAAERHVPGQYSTIQAAINDCNNGDVVIVAPGTYTGAGNRDIDFGGKAITVQSIDPSDPLIVAATIIDCEGTETENHRGFYFHNSEDANSILTGLTITNGFADEGGGIFCVSPGPETIPTINNCIITGNSAVFSGGGIQCEGSWPELTVSNCVISSNNAERGGGIGTYSYGTLNVKNCLIKDNNAVYGGGVSVYCWSDNSKISSCTIINNTADYGGGVNIDWTSEATISNCIVWGNSAENGPEICLGEQAELLTVNYSDVYNRDYGIFVGGGTLNWGAGNIDANPLFVTGPLGDYYLSQTPGGQVSPCVDAGSDTAANLGLNTLTTRNIDQAGDVNIVDMGYHYPVTIANPADISENLFVNMTDFAILARQWLEAPGEPPADIAPYNGDGTVNMLDLAVVADSWLDCYVTPATNPRPFNNAVTVSPEPTLLWSAGNSYHDVYFGSDPNAVAGADHLSAEFMDTFSDANFTPDTLDLNSTYYWRVDEVGPECMKIGQVWTFTTAPSWPRPQCWYWPYQCHGDADGKSAFGKRVTESDREIFLAAYPSRYPEPKYNPCADFDRDGYVSADDNDILLFWYNKVGVPNDCPQGGQWPPLP